MICMCVFTCSCVLGYMYGVCECIQMWRPEDNPGYYTSDARWFVFLR